MSATTVQESRVSARTALIGVVGATAAAVAVWTAVTTAGVHLAAGFGDGQPIRITLVSVVAAAALATLAGWALLAVLVRFTARARTVWSLTAVATVLASLAGPLTATASAGTKLSLVTMHLVTATVLILVLRRSIR